MDDICFTTFPDLRFPGRFILIGTRSDGAAYHASFVGRREKAEAAIRAAASKPTK